MLRRLPWNLSFLALGFGVFFAARALDASVWVAALVGGVVATGVEIAVERRLERPRR